MPFAELGDDIGGTTAAETTETTCYCPLDSVIDAISKKYVI